MDDMHFTDYIKDERRKHLPASDTLIYLYVNNDARRAAYKKGVPRFQTFFSGFERCTGKCERVGVEGKV